MKGKIRKFKKEIITTWHHRADALEISAGIWPLVMGQSKARPSYRVGPRTVSYFSLHLILEGKLHFQMENVERTLHVGDLFCLFPDVLHTYRIASPDETLRLTWLALNGSQAELLLQNVGITKETPILENAATEKVTSLFRQLIGIISEPDQGKSAKIISMIYELFHLLNIHSHLQQVPSNPKEWVRKAVEFIELQYAQQGIRVHDVAQSLGVDRSHLTKTFSKYMGMGPKKYIQKVRLNKGAAMLAETRLSVTEIALSLGYPDVCTFSRAFSSFHHISPFQFRQQQ